MQVFHTMSVLALLIMLMSSLPTSKTNGVIEYCAQYLTTMSQFILNFNTFILKCITVFIDCFSEIDLFLPFYYN